LNDIDGVEVHHVAEHWGVDADGRNSGIRPKKQLNMIKLTIRHG